MADIIALYTTLTVFGVGVTIVDFLGILDHAGHQDDSGADSHDQSHSVSDEQHGSNLITDKNSAQTTFAQTAFAQTGFAQTGFAQTEFANSKKEQKNEKLSFKVISAIMNVLRGTVYFSLGFGPTGLFASFSEQSRTSGFLWAFGVGIITLICARLVRRLIRRDTDSSIKPDELLQEKGVLLLPLEGELISKAAVRQYGREIEIYVRSRDKNINLLKGKEIIIEEYDNDVYWVIPAETEGV